MTLTELKYLVALAREKHFGRAAESCFVSQPTLSIAIKRLEEELGSPLFERRSSEVQLTPGGEQIVQRAQRVLNEAAALKETAKQTHDPLAGALRLGAIFTIAPYLLPQLVGKLKKIAPKMPLLIQENYTVRLKELLAQGELDAIIVATPFTLAGRQSATLYVEPFLVAVPQDHPLAGQPQVRAEDLCGAVPLMLGSGHCLRDHILQQLPALAGARDGAAQWEGGSLETLRQMVGSGSGISIFPSSAVLREHRSSCWVRYIPFATPVPKREVLLVWRESFPRAAAVQALQKAISQCDLPGVRFNAEETAIGKNNRNDKKH